MGFDGTLKGCHVVMYICGLLYFRLYHLMRDLWDCMCFLYLGKDVFLCALHEAGVELCQVYLCL